MNAWKVIVATLVIFVAGIVTGDLLATIAMRLQQGHPKPPNANLMPAQNANPWQVRNRDLLHRMDRELELTPEQHNSIEKIIVASQERTKALWKPIAPQMNKEMQSVRTEIRDQLTADQRAKFDALIRPKPGMERRRQPTNSPLAGPAETVSTNSVPATNAAVTQ